MMMECYSSTSSPFDEALARPFLDEPVRKRWSLCSLLSSTSAVSCGASTSTREDDDEERKGLLGASEHDQSEQVDNHDTNANDVEAPPSITSKGSHQDYNDFALSVIANTDTRDLLLILDDDDDDEEQYNAPQNDVSKLSSVFSNPPPVLMPQPIRQPQKEVMKSSLSTLNNAIDLAFAQPPKISLEVQEVCIEMAVLKERHEGIAEITSSMKQINQIQQDLAQVVESQDSDIEQLSWNAISSFEHAEKGRRQLEKVYEMFRRNNRKRSFSIFILVMGFVFVVASTYWASTAFSGNRRHGLHRNDGLVMAASSSSSHHNIQLVSMPATDTASPTAP